MNFNKVILVGRAIKDVEIRTTASGKMVANLSLVTNNVYVDKAGNKVDNADFHNIVLWGQIADSAKKYCHKGQTVLVEGRIQTRSFETKAGEKRYITEIVAERFQMAPNQVGTMIDEKNDEPAEPDPLGEITW